MMSFSSFVTWGVVLLSLCPPNTAASLTTTPQRNGFTISAIKVFRDLKSQQSDLSSRANGQDSIDVGSNWALPVSLGTPPQSFLMTPDTGAPSLAVKSIFLPSNETDNSPVYNPNASSTATQLGGYTYQNCYGSGHCGHGLVYNDTVTVGTTTVQMAFEVSTGNNGISNGDATNTGDFGLNFAQPGMTTHPTHVPSWLQVVLPRLDQQLFTIDYNPTTSQGTFDFGFIDTTKYTGSLGYTPVVNSGTGGQWTLHFTGFQAGPSAAFNGTTPWTAIVDSGTGASTLPAAVVAAYFATIPNATFNPSTNKYHFPCPSPSAALPDFIFGIANASDYRGHIPLNATQTGNGDCTTKLLADGGDGTVVFGQNFIEDQFVVFDYEGARVGFANKGGEGGAASTASGTATATATVTSSGTGTPAQTSSGAASSGSSSKTSGAEPAVSRSAVSQWRWICVLWIGIGTGWILEML